MGAGGTGGGGNGVWNTPCSGVANTGGGGGAVGSPGATAGSGGSGLVLINQPSSSPTFSIAPGVWSLSDAYNYKKAGQWTS